MAEGSSMHTVYVLLSQKDGNWYIGCTANIERRLSLHNAGKVPATRGRRPLQLLYTEVFADKYEAFNTERFYKSAKGKRVLKAKVDK